MVHGDVRPSCPDAILPGFMAPNGDVEHLGKRWYSLCVCVPYVHMSVSVYVKNQILDCVYLNYRLLLVKRFGVWEKQNGHDQG